MGEIQNVTKKEFICAMHGLGACGEVDVLVGLMKKAARPDTKEIIERAIRLAMKVSRTNGWSWAGVNAACMVEMEWSEAAPIRRVLRGEFSDETKEIAKKILKTTPEMTVDFCVPCLSEAGLRKKKEHEKKKPQHISKVTSYIGKELREAEKGVLSRGTVRPPKGKAVAHCAGKGINTLKAQ